MHKIVEDLNWRYACKKFDTEKKISDEDFNSLLESLRLTASSFGLQQWKFLVIKDEKIRHELMEASYHQHQVKDASHLIVLTTYTQFDEKFVDDFVADTAKTNGKSLDEMQSFKKMLMMVPNFDVDRQASWGRNQIYIALGNLLTVCANMRIDSCPMEGFSNKKYDEILGLKEKGLTSVLVCPVGYRATDDKYATAPKVRYSLEKLVEEY